MDRPTLAERIQARLADFLPQIPAQDLEVMQETTRRLMAQGLAQQAVQPGDRAPDFTLPTPDGRHLSLTDLRRAGPVVLDFYRGAWCPYCNLELRALDEILPEIRARGAELVAIAPNLPGKTAAFLQENPFGFDFLCDVDNRVARRYGLVFTLPEALVAIYRRFGFDLEAFDGNDRHELPMPATYVVAPNGIVFDGFVHENYLRRMEPAAILEALDRLADRPDVA
ncbi:MAG: AhpC/TSA family protein [Gammaproteobacteria bacterium]|nr:MAG: AhpC/TSA family protein [Gammaproteobacteria bacterium]